MSIVVSELTVCRQGKTILNAVSFHVAAGSFAVLLGRNGSGKSTLLQTLIGTVRPSAGTISVAGRDIVHLTSSERARLLGYFPQFHRSVFPFRAIDVVLTGCAGHIRFLPRPTDHVRAEEAMARAGVAALRDRTFTELSGGEQQMVLIARLLAQAPQVVLLDEPTSHLDLHYQSQVLALIRRMTAHGTTVLAVVHDPNIALNYAEQVLLLAERTIVSLPPYAVGVDLLEYTLGARLDVVQGTAQRVVFPSLVHGEFCSKEATSAPPPSSTVPAVP